MQQMQMQRQAMANPHSASAGNVNTYSNPPPNAQAMNQGMGGQSMPYTSQQIAAAAVNAGLSTQSQGQPMNAGGSNIPIRTYLDQTVIPILADGKFVFFLSVCRTFCFFIFRNRTTDYNIFFINRIVRACQGASTEPSTVSCVLFDST
jgi:hypothetical protein